MFGRKRSIKTAHQNHSLKVFEKDFENLKPLTLTLGSNRLTFVDGRQWIHDSTDLDVMTQEIIILENENEELRSALKLTEEKSEVLCQNLSGISKLKTVAMDMLTEERLKSTRLEQELVGYKAELSESYRIILELRKLIDEDQSTEQK